MATVTARLLPVIVFVLATTPVPAQQTFRFDPERLFNLGDADIDGRLSADEYLEFMKRSPRFRGGAAGIRRYFDRLDRNRDGFLSLGEYLTSFPDRRTDPARPTDQPTETPPARITPEQETFFENRIRPVLATHCGKCHSKSAEDVGAHLYVDSREGLRRGGDSGAAIVPGHPDRSLLIQAIRYSDDLQMPPDEPLPAAVIADFETWVKMGAPDPRSSGATPSDETSGALSKGREFWSFQLPVRVEPPAVAATDWPRDDIDRFLLARLEAEGLQPVGDAARSRLLRRVTFDLTGLPPTPDELDAFLQDDSPRAFEAVVDRLLASPHFGERWGRHWLDVARYGESTGKTNFNYPQAWRYRDWAISAFNDDKPYDRFIREQIAGDLLPADDDTQRAGQLVATGFLAMGTKALDNLDNEQFQLDMIDEQIDSTSRAFLGLTVSCARCHDHKLDPISQQDYYALAGIFRSTQTCYGTLPGVFPNFNGSSLIELPDDADVPSSVEPIAADRRARMEQRLEALLAQRAQVPRDQANRDRMRRLTSQISTLQYRLLIDRPEGDPRRFAMGVQEHPLPRNSPLYVRGELSQPGRIVPRGLIAILRSDATPAITTGSGRRELADWLASPENPLTARVMVNRVWMHLFGRGLVATPDNFGHAGARPSHPELLDTLAVDFMEDGWSIKRLIRRMVLSRAYGLDSTFDERNYEIDPDNALVWRMSKRRLEGEVIRDALLFVSGSLETSPPTGSIVARVGEGLSAFVRAQRMDVMDRHRSVYLPVVRDQVSESLSLFDFADPNLVSGLRPTTTGPAQALYFMNGELVLRESDVLAASVLRRPRSHRDRIAALYRRLLAREPTPAEQEQALTFLDEFNGRGDSDDAREAWSAFCQALLASAEFRYLD